MSGAGSFTPRSPRTGHEPLDSSGSCHSIALRHNADLPVSKQTAPLPRQLAQPMRGPSLADSILVLSGFTENVARCRLALSEAYFASGQVDAAMNESDECERLCQRHGWRIQTAHMHLQRVAIHDTLRIMALRESC